MLVINKLQLEKSTTAQVIQQLENENNRLRNEIKRLKLHADAESGHLDEPEPPQKKGKKKKRRRRRNRKKRHGGVENEQRTDQGESGDQQLK